jgi:carbon monoxide dehydrogenase subunit G
LPSAKEGYSMKMSGEEIIPASREEVWKALNDPAILKQCIPGCETITKHSDTQMEARVVVKLGPVKARFSGTVNLTDLDPPNGYRISGQGNGGLAGNASGGANVRLEAVADGTRLSYDVDAQVGGKIASLGARFIDPTARALATQFFEKFSAIAAATAAPRAPAKVEAAPAVEVVPAAEPAPVAQPPKKAAPKKPAAKKAAAKKPAKKAAKKPAAKKPAKKKR